MALFAGGRDASLVRKLNTELMRRWIDTEIEFYKLSMNDTQDNIYMEADSKKYFQPMKLHCTVQKDPREIAAGDAGLDSNRLGTFAFIRNDLKDASIVIEIGDLIWWDGDYYEIDNVNGSQYWSGRNPETLLGTTSGEIDEFGYSVSITCDTHVTRRNKISVVETRSGVNNRNIIPRNL